MAYLGRIRSPETKTEVKQAANILFVLGSLFGVGALMGAGFWLLERNPDWLILIVVLGDFSAFACCRSLQYLITATNEASL